MSEPQGPGGKPKGYPKTGGRAKGTQNKITREIKEMIVTALEEVGGVEYLKQRAVDTPGPFLTLVGKVLPLQLTGDRNNPIAIQEVAHRIIK